MTVLAEANQPKSVMAKYPKVLIVGGVAGGASAAARLRRLSETAEIVLFERGEYISYANCGLPYYIGGEIAEKSALTLQTPGGFSKRFNVDVRIRHEVTAIDRAAKTIFVQNIVTGEEYREKYDKMILSPGAEPVRPEGFESDRIFTLRNIPDTFRIEKFIETEKPQSAVVIGAGYIGLEMAENLHRLGIEVTIVQRGKHVLAPLDFDMACDVHRHIENRGVRLLLENEVQSVEDRNGTLHASLKDGSELAANMIVLAIGVKPESDLAKKAWINTTDRGAIVVSDHMLTSDSDIYAVGDAVEVIDPVTRQKVYIPLAGPANRQGRIAADNICGLDSRYGGTQGASILRVFDLTVAMTALSEHAAAAAGLKYEKSFTVSPNHAGYYPGATDMTIKTIFERETGRILGAQIVGYDGVDKRCDVIATAIRARMTVSDLASLELCYAPPYSSAKDPVNMAGFVGQNICAGKVKVVHWHDIPSLQKAGNVILLDVRTPTEYRIGHIDGFINVPLDELRDRLGELDRSRKIYATCQVGQRGYYAARILMQNGFDAYNLSGGYRLYRSIFGPVIPVVVSSPKKREPKPISVTTPLSGTSTKVIAVNACGLQCPGPIMKLAAAMNEAAPGDTVEISVTDPAFAGDLDGYCRRTGSTLLDIAAVKGITTAKILKGDSAGFVEKTDGHGKNFIVFSGDLDKTIAAFIMANAAAAMGRKVSMFFTFWGLNVLRKPDFTPGGEKTFMASLFSWMMPKGSTRLPLSKMNFFGIGSHMIRNTMTEKHIDSLETLIITAQKNGVELIACSMSMDVMGIRSEELINGVKLGGAAAMLAHAEESDMSLFI